ncbi:hypothetical protein WJX72_009816 [[Myrmecia] bisecta]|uniref:Uncharacterized protein n=1 Tax=[Myrmecia] bisecta TaxID=41462 RepID=A0AAW1PP35_9CHLO
MDLPDEIVRHIATFTTASSSHQGPPRAHSFPDLTLGWATPEAFAKHLAASRLQRLHIAGRVEFRIKRRGQPATTGTLVDLRQAVMEHASQEFDVEGGSESLAIARRPAAI